MEASSAPRRPQARQLRAFSATTQGPIGEKTPSAACLVWVLRTPLCFSGSFPYGRRPKNRASFRHPRGLRVTETSLVLFMVRRGIGLTCTGTGVLLVTCFPEVHVHGRLEL